MTRQEPGKKRRFGKQCEAWVPVTMPVDCPWDEDQQASRQMFWDSVERLALEKRLGAISMKQEFEAMERGGGLLCPFRESRLGEREMRTQRNSIMSGIKSRILTGD